MARTLDVYLHQHLIGKLIQDDQGNMRFTYVESWLSNPKAIPLSRSLPLTNKHFNRKACRGYFAGVLPDESKREIIARNLGISARNDFAMLEQIGGECAGAVTFLPDGQSLPQRDYAYRPLSPQELAEKLRALPHRPLLAGEEGIRLSLAGAQDKIPVHVSRGQISLPLNESPSTHILKPAIERFAGVVFNEALCMKLAQAAGLQTAHVEVGNVEGIDYLLVERYDRAVVIQGEERLRREHQEDFCQALGVVPERKYQAEGGPSLKQCFALVREESSRPVVDLQSLLDAVIFNWLIGNNDAHGKNFSLVYPGEMNLGLQIRLAPLYDLLSTAYYPELSPKMAMKLGGEYLSERVSPPQFERLAEEAGLAKPMVTRRVLELGEAIEAALPSVTTEHPVTAAVVKVLQGRSERLLRKFKM
jgi:serine/threonine-protein kinase HipA